MARDFLRGLLGNVSLLSNYSCKLGAFQTRVMEKNIFAAVAVN